MIVRHGRTGEQEKTGKGFHAKLRPENDTKAYSRRLNPASPQFPMPRFVTPAVSYVALIFAAAFVLGALRVTLIAPATGPLLAVALEVPVVLALSWLVAGRLLNRWPLRRPDRLAMGALAFALLMLAELALALAFGQTPARFLADLATPPGTLGLAGQIGFGLIPILRQPRG
jgi:hypothetical protein